MTEEEFKKLGVGDALMHVTGGHSVIVTGNYGDHVTAVRTVDVTNPDEWRIIRKVHTDESHS